MKTLDEYDNLEAVETEDPSDEKFVYVKVKMHTPNRMKRFISGSKTTWKKLDDLDTICDAMTQDRKTLELFFKDRTGETVLLG